MISALASRRTLAASHAGGSGFHCSRLPMPITMEQCHAKIPMPVPAVQGDGV
jgi:hypothetical protein